MASISYKTRNDSAIKPLRPIYYLGSKAGYTNAIRQAIDEVDPSGGRVADVFAGTGAVSAALGRDREVTAIDVQEYARVLCSATLNPHALSASELQKARQHVLYSDTATRIRRCMQPLINYERECIAAAESGAPAALVELLESPPLVVRAEVQNNISSRLDEIAAKVLQQLFSEGLSSADTIVSRYFGGLYFSFQQAATLDSALSFIDTAPRQNQDTLKAAVLSTASQLVNTVGKQFAQPIQPRNKNGLIKTNLVRLVQRDRFLDAGDIFRIWIEKYATLPAAIGEPLAIRQDYLSAISQHAASFSVVYADPPYTRDHYSRFYHVLETICLRDNPRVSKITKNGKRVHSRAAYREERHQSEFCIRSTAPTAFGSLFKTVAEHNLPLVLSYSPHETGDGTHPRVMGLEKIVELARKYYDRVEISIVEGAVHNQLNRTDLKLKQRDNAEILLKCFL